MDSTKVTKPKMWVHKAKIKTGLLLAEIFIDRGDFEHAYEILKKTTRYFTGNITGYYVNWELESLLKRIAEKKINFTKETKKSDGNNILHVFSGMYKSGGHTKLAANWIKFDKEHSHTIVITRMSQDEVQEAALHHQLENIEIIMLSGNDFEKAEELNRLSKSFGKIVFHIHMDDCIPVLAFSTDENNPPIYFLNHADHIFWMGISITDVLVQIRPSNIPIDAVRRGISEEKQFVLPIPIDVRENPEKIARDKINILTTGTSYKYRPYGKKNLLQNFLDVLTNHSNLELFVAGMNGKESYAIQHPNIHYLGIVNNLHEYENNCDIYLETYPFSSFTAMLQVMAIKKPVQLMYQPPICMRYFEENSGIHYPSNEKQWKENLNKLILNESYRKETAEKQYQYVKQHNSMESWQKKLKQLYNSTPKERDVKKDHWVFGDNEIFLRNHLSPRQIYFDHDFKMLTKIELLKNPSLVFFKIRFLINRIKF